MSQHYDWKKTAKKFVFGFLAAGLALLAFGIEKWFPAIGEMTVVGALLALANFLKHYAGLSMNLEFFKKFLPK